MATRYAYHPGNVAHRRHPMDAHLLPQTSDVLDEVIGLLEDELCAYE